LRQITHRVRKPRPPARLISIGILAGAAILTAPAAIAQEAEHVQEAEHGEHGESSSYRHYISLSGAAATHTENNDTGGALGLSYGYKLSDQWAAGIKLEYADSDIERDLVALLGVTYEPVERLEFAVGFGVERVDTDEVEGGEEHTAAESEALVRLTYAYIFPLGGRWHLGPEFNADIVGGRVTYVYGLVLSLGL
jgi:hypothetical protein